MCGIFGAYGTAGKARIKEFLVQASYVDSMRGWDSTGAARATTKGVLTFKKAVDGGTFGTLREAEPVLKYSNKTLCVIGHNRAATRGSVKDENAHPFTREHITLVHNGFIQNAWECARDAGLSYKDWDVDSDTACALIAAKGADKALPQFRGAYVLVWWDERERSLNFAANDQRPLWFAKINDEKAGSDAVLFGSERGMLRWLAGRNGMLVVEDWQIPTHTHVKISFDKNGAAQKPHLVPYTPFPEPTWSSTTSRGAYAQYSDTSHVSSYDSTVRELSQILDQTSGIRVGRKEVFILTAVEERTPGQMLLLLAHESDPSVTSRIPVSEVRPWMYEFAKKNHANCTYIEGQVERISYLGKGGTAKEIYARGEALVWLVDSSLEFFDERMDCMATSAKLREAYMQAQGHRQEGQKSRTVVSLVPSVGQILVLMSPPGGRVGHEAFEWGAGALFKFLHPDKDLHMHVVQDVKGKTWKLKRDRFRKATAQEAVDFSAAEGKLRLH